MKSLRAILLLSLLAMLVGPAAQARGRESTPLRWLAKGRSLRSLGVTQHRTKGLVARNEALTRARAKELGLVWVAPHTRTLKSGTVVQVKGHFRGKAIPPQKQLSDIVVSDRALHSFDRKIAGQRTELWHLFVNLRLHSLRLDSLEARVARARASQDVDEAALPHLLQTELTRTRRLVTQLRALLPAHLSQPRVRDNTTVIWQRRPDGRLEWDGLEQLKDPKMSRLEHGNYLRLLPELEARGKKDFLKSAGNRNMIDADTERDIKDARFAAHQAAGRLPVDAVSAAYDWVKGRRGKPGTFRRKANWQPPPVVDLRALNQRLEAASQGPLKEDLPALLRIAAFTEYSKDYNAKALREELDAGGQRAGEIAMALLGAQKSFKDHSGRFANHAKLQGNIDITWDDISAMKRRLEANPRTRARLEAWAKAALADRVQTPP